jgi:hypothetical protein
LVPGAVQPRPGLSASADQTPDQRQQAGGGVQQSGKKICQHRSHPLLSIIGRAKVTRPVRHILPIQRSLLPAPVGRGSRRFTGRLPELWQIHTALHADVLTGISHAQPLVLHGAPAIGKSLLAQEYALRFGSASPAQSSGSTWAVH